MKSLIKQFSNWRTVLLGMMFLTAMLIGGSEADSARSFLLSKFIAFALGALSAWLGKRWHDKGLIDLGEE